MRDPYQLLGVERTATGEEIKQAYRRLAKKYHPDLNPGRAEIEQRFKEISAAYAILSDPQKRGRFDRGEIDANGSEQRSSHAHARHARSQRRRPQGPPPGGGFGGDDFFSDLFGTRRRSDGSTSAQQQQQSTRTGPGRKGGDINYAVHVSFNEAALGTRRRVELSSGKALEITIPAGTRDQQKLRLKNQGLPGENGAAAGDAIIEVHVEPHPLFAREADDIHLEVPVTLPEALLGGVIRVPTLGAAVAVRVPPGSNTGTILRLKGKGIPHANGQGAGDQFVKLKVVLPDPPDPDLVEFVERWARSKSYEVRKKVGME